MYLTEKNPIECSGIDNGKGNVNTDRDDQEDTEDYQNVTDRDRDPIVNIPDQLQEELIRVGGH
jgi:hypothetical protein